MLKMLGFLRLLGILVDAETGVDRGEFEAEKGWIIVAVYVR